MKWYTGFHVFSGFYLKGAESSVIGKKRVPINQCTGFLVDKMAEQLMYLVFLFLSDDYSLARQQRVLLPMVLYYGTRTHTYRASKSDTHGK